MKPYLIAIILMLGCNNEPSVQVLPYKDPSNLKMARVFSDKARNLLINKMIPNLGNRDSIIHYHATIMAYLEAADSILNIKQ